MPPAELAAYFTAERQGGFFLVALALVSFGFAATLWAPRRSRVAAANHRPGRCAANAGASGVARARVADIQRYHRGG